MRRQFVVIALLMLPMLWMLHQWQRQISGEAQMNHAFDTVHLFIEKYHPIPKIKFTPVTLIKYSTVYNDGGEVGVEGLLIEDGDKLLMLGPEESEVSEEGRIVSKRAMLKVAGLSKANLSRFYHLTKVAGDSHLKYVIVRVLGQRPGDGGHDLTITSFEEVYDFVKGGFVKI